MFLCMWTDMIQTDACFEIFLLFSPSSYLIILDLILCRVTFIVRSSGRCICSYTQNKIYAWIMLAFASNFWKRNMLCSSPQPLHDFWQKIYLYWWSEQWEWWWDGWRGQSWLLTSQGRAIVVTKMRIACGAGMASMVTFSALQHNTIFILLYFYTSGHNSLSEGTNIRRYKIQKSLGSEA